MHAQNQSAKLLKTPLQRHAMMILKAATLALIPALMIQGWRVKKNTPRLPEPEGMREGQSGSGQALSILIAPDRIRAIFAHAGPINSYKTEDDKIIVKSISSISADRILLPKKASPMATPAWGIKANPK